MKLAKRNADIIIETTHKTVKETVLYCIENKINLSGAYLIGADLSGADLSRADLSGADLRGADLIGADLSGADLSRVNLNDADLSGADLIGADLSGANLSGAYLSGAKNIFIFNKENGRTCYAVRHEIGLMIKAGCFWGTLAEFEAQCLSEYPNDSKQAYAAQIAYLKTL